MQHTHEHDYSPPSAENRQYLSIYLKAWGLTFVIAGIELVGSILSGSFALLADISHVFTDTVVGLGPLSVEYFRKRVSISQERLEQIGGIVVSIVLIYVGYHIIGEAREGLSGEGEHEVEGAVMFIFAGAAALTNLLQHRLLGRVSPMHRHAAHAGFHFHVLTDLVKNLALPILALLIFLGAPMSLDIWAAYAIGWLILVRAALLAFEGILGKRIVQQALDRFLHWIMS